MDTAKKTKLCWNCEGVVDRQSENCIYCGVYLHPEEEIQDVEEEFDVSPPYQPKEEAPFENEDSDNFYESMEDELEHDLADGTAYELKEKKKENRSEDIRGVILPLIFLLTGSVFLLFSLMLFLFSKDGIFILKWNANYWFVYLLFSVPLLYIGWRTLQYFEETENAEENNNL